MEEIKRLYDLAWTEYASTCLWNVKRLAEPSTAHAAVVAMILRRRGDLNAAMLGDRLKKACDAA